MVGKFLIRLGEWFNTHFPEKVSADEVYRKMAAIELRLQAVTELESKTDAMMGLWNQHNERLADMAKKVEVLTSENAALKAASAMRTKIASSIPMPGR